MSTLDKETVRELFEIRSQVRQLKEQKKAVQTRIGDLESRHRKLSQPVLKFLHSGEKRGIFVPNKGFVEMKLTPKKLVDAKSVRIEAFKSYFEKKGISDAGTEAAMIVQWEDNFKKQKRSESLITDPAVSLHIEDDIERAQKLNSKLFKADQQSAHMWSKVTGDAIDKMVEGVEEDGDESEGGANE